jgi:hypothetical protein
VIHHPSKCDRQEVRNKEKPINNAKTMLLTKVLQAIQEEAGAVSSDEENDE